jgi:hypothetical protein
MSELFTSLAMRLFRTSRGRPREGRGFVPAFELLETRRMLAVSATFSATSGVLNVFGDSADNTIQVSRDAAGALLVNGGAADLESTCSA